MSSSQHLLKILGPAALRIPRRYGGVRTDCRTLAGGLYHGGGKSEERKWCEVRTGIVPRRIGDIVKDQDDKEEEEKRKSDRENRKAEMKDYSERSPAWLSREHDESDLVKHIEVLQRFADRYNSAYGHQSVKEPSDEEGRKRLAKIMDKPPNKKFSTLVRSREKKRKDTRKGGRLNTEMTDLKTFITLANEPRRREPLEPKPKPPVPSVKHLPNPDSVILQSFADRRPSQTPRPRIYSILNPKLKSKEYEAYLKRTFPTMSNKEPIKQKKVEATIGDYFSNRYAPTPKSTVGKREREAPLNFKDGLLEERRKGMSASKVRPEPILHPKTSLLVQKTHLPLTKCKNMRKESFRESTPSVEASQVDLQVQRDNSNSPAQNTLLNRIIKYFKR